MADNRGILPLLGKLLNAALYGRHDTIAYGGQVAEIIGLGEDGGPEAAERLLGRTLAQVPGDPAGTVTDLASGEPRTVTRDGGCLVIPALRLDADGCAALRQVINNEIADLAAAQAVSD